MIGSVVAEKRFIWKFIDQATQGVKNAKMAMQDAESAAKKVGMEVSGTSTHWEKYGSSAKKATSEVSEQLQKNKEAFENYRNRAVDATKDVTRQLNLYEDKLKGVPSYRTTNFKVKVDDPKLASWARKVHDVPKEKSTWLKIKDAASNQLSYIKLRLQELPVIKQITVAVHDNASGPVTGLTGKTKMLGSTFSSVKTIMAGTFLGNAALQGINAIGRAMGGLIKVGWDYNAQQQTMKASWDTLTGSASKGQAMVDMTNKLATSAQNSTTMVNELNQKLYAVTNSADKTRDLSKAMLTLQDAFNVSDASLENFATQWSQMVGNGKASAQDMLSIQNVFPKFRGELLDYERKVTHNKNLTMKEMNDMMSKGQISSDAMNHVLIGMSHTYKNATNNFSGTIRGMIRTAKSAAPRILGPLMAPLTNAANPILKAFSKWMADPKTEKAAKNLGKKMQQDFSEVAKTVGEIASPFKDLVIVVGKLLGLFASGVWKGFSNVMKIIWDAIKLVADAFGKLWNPIDKSVSKMKGLGSTSKYIEGLGQIVGTVAGSMIGFAGAVKVVSLAFKGATAIMNAWRAATKAMALAQTALNIVLAANPIGLIVIAITAVIAALVLAYKKSKPFREFVNGMGKKVAKMAKDVINWFKKIGKAIGDSFTGKAGWEKNLRKQYQKARKEAQQNAKEQQKIEQQQQKRSEKQWQKHWKALQKGSSNLWNGFVRDAKKGMQNIQKTHDKWSKNFQKGWNRTWQNIGRFTNRTWQSLKKDSANGINNMHRSISNGLNAISGTWNNIWNGLKNFFGNIWDGIKKIAQDGMNAVISVINGGIGAIDAVWSFFTGHGSGIKKLGKVHFAQGGTVHRSLSVVNDGPGDDWKELMQFPDGSFGMAQERNWTGFLPVGTRIYSGPETKQIMNMAGIDHYATGGVVGAQHFAGGGIVRALEGWIAKIGDAVSGMDEKFRSMEDYLEAPVQRVKNAVQNAVGSNYGPLGHWGELAHGEWDKITDGMKHWVQHTITQFLYSFEGKSLSRDMMRSAATINKLKPSDGFFNMLWQVIMSESGGRNIVQQVHDVNSGGNEAAGILQYTPGTFAKYALPGHGERMNDFNQLLAFFNNTDWLGSIGSTIIRGVQKLDWLHSGPQGGTRNNFWPMLATGGEVFGTTAAIIGDNPEHHEFVINPYAPSAGPLLSKAAAATANAQGMPASSPSGDSSKLDQAVALLAKLVDLVGDIDPQIIMDMDKLTAGVNKKNAKTLGMVKG